MKSHGVGRDHVGIALEMQILQWVREWFQFPPTSRGVFVTGLLLLLAGLIENRLFNGEFHECPRCKAMV